MGTRHASGGNTLDSRDRIVNFADIAERLNRRFTAVNSFEVATAYPVIGLKSNYGLSNLRDVTEATGSGAVSNVVGDGAYTVSTGSTANSQAKLETASRGRYVSGTVSVPGIGVRLTDTPTGDQVARWGYFDTDNGIGFGEDANGLFVFRRIDGTDDIVRQENWNDPFDGSGFSGLTLDPGTINIYRMPFRWYGSGPVRFQVSNGAEQLDIIDAHTIEADDKPILREPNLPVSVEVENGGTAADLSIEVFGRQFSVLGVYDPEPRITSEFRETQSVDTTFTPLVSFRQKDDYSAIAVKISGASLLVGNNPVVWEIRIGGTLTDAAFTAPTDTPASETALEFDTSATAISGGQAVFTDLGASGTKSTATGSVRDLPDLDIPVGEILTLCAKTISSTTEVTSVLRGKEEW